MPLFMLISGYFFITVQKGRLFSQILKGKVKSLVIPIVTYAFIIKVYDYFIGDCDGTALFYDFFRLLFLIITYGFYGQYILIYYL